MRSAIMAFPEMTNGHIKTETVRLFARQLLVSALQILLYAVVKHPSMAVRKSLVFSAFMRS